jgi:UDP-3-O-[3-hydroxymyristoyl] N-acetylglucosamine deacetylase
VTQIAVGDSSILSMEHLLGAVHVVGLTDLVIDVEGGEPPMGSDVSAGHFTRAIQRAGIRHHGPLASTLRLPDDLSFGFGDSRAWTVSPSPSHRLLCTVKVDFPEPIGSRWCTADVSSSRDAARLVMARSFLRSAADQLWPDGRTSWQLVASDLRGLTHPGGGQLITYDRAGTWIDQPRWRAEPLHHKILDLLGDLLSIGRRLTGHLVVERPGHDFNLELARHLSRGQVDEHGDGTNGGQEVPLRAAPHTDIPVARGTPVARQMDAGRVGV